MGEWEAANEWNRVATRTGVRRGGVGQARNERVAVSAIGRVETAAETRVVRIVGLSATTALVFAPRPIGQVGQCVDIFLPFLCNRELRVTAGIASITRLDSGEALTLDFIIAEVQLRRDLNELVALLLAGDGDAVKQPSVIYDVPVRYGLRGERVGRLEELAPTDLILRTDERLLHGTPMMVTVPCFRDGEYIVIVGRVVAQTLSREGGYHTTIAFDALDDERRTALSRLIADLMCR